MGPPHQKSKRPHKRRTRCIPEIRVKVSKSRRRGWSDTCHWPISKNGYWMDLVRSNIRAIAVPWLGDPPLIGILSGGRRFHNRGSAGSKCGNIIDDLRSSEVVARLCMVPAACTRATPRPPLAGPPPMAPALFGVCDLAMLSCSSSGLPPRACAHSGSRECLPEPALPRCSSPASPSRRRRSALRTASDRSRPHKPDPATDAGRREGAG